MDRDILNWKITIPSRRLIRDGSAIMLHRRIEDEIQFSAYQMLQDRSD